MYVRSAWSMSWAWVIAVAIVVAIASMNNADAACYTPQQALPAQTVNAFIGNPGQLLQQYPSGGPQMISQIRDLAASDPATLPAIIGMLANASKDQKTAIGSGLGQAAKVCGGRDQAYATQIQDAVVQSRDAPVVLAYAAITGEQPLGGVGGGAGGGGSAGASGGQTNSLGVGPTSTGGAALIGGSSTPTGPFGFTGSVSGGGGSISNTTTTTTTGSVSP